MFCATFSPGTFSFVTAKAHFRLRGTWVGTYLPVDDNIKFHKYLGWVIAVLTSIHVLAHAVNFYNIGYVSDPNAVAELGLLPRGAEPRTEWYFLCCVSRNSPLQGKCFPNSSWLDWTVHLPYYVCHVHHRSVWNPQAHVWDFLVFSSPLHPLLHFKFVSRGGWLTRATHFLVLDNWYISYTIA